MNDTIDDTYLSPATNVLYQQQHIFDDNGKPKAYYIINTETNQHWLIDVCEITPFGFLADSLDYDNYPRKTIEVPVYQGPQPNFLYMRNRVGIKKPVKTIRTSKELGVSKPTLSISKT